MNLLSNFPFNIAHAEELANPLSVNSFGELVIRIAEVFGGLAGGVATLVILYGAFLIMRSGGQPEMLVKGKNAVIYALIGVVIVFFSVALVSLIVDVVGGK